jgi:outer membrane lipoprotein SlyB
MNTASKSMVICLKLIPLIVILQGCSTFDGINDAAFPSSYKTISNQLTSNERNTIQTVCIEVSAKDFKTDFKGLSKGKGAGAAQGAVLGGLEGCAASIEFPPAIIIMAPAGIVIGGVAGAAMSESKDEVERQVTCARASTRSRSLCDQLALQFFEASGILPGSGNAGSRAGNQNVEAARTSLEIVLTRVGSRTANYNPYWFKRDVVDIYIETHVRLIRSTDGALLYEGKYYSRNKASESKGFKDWTDNDARLMRKEIKHGLGRIAESVIRDVFQCDKSQIVVIPQKTAWPDGSLGRELNVLAHKLDNEQISYEEYHQSLTRLVNVPDSGSDQ